MLRKDIAKKMVGTGGAWFIFDINVRLPTSPHRLVVWPSSLLDDGGGFDL